MTIPRLFAALLLASSVRAQTRVSVPAVAPGAGIVPLQYAAPAPIFSAPALSAPLSAPFPLAAAVSMTAPALVASALQPIRPAPSAPLPVKISALTAGITKTIAALGERPSGAASLTAGREIEALLTGAALSAPSAGELDAEVPATPEELAHALGVSARLAARADDLGAAKGLKAGTMSGADFLSLLEEAHAAAQPAPTPSATAAASAIEAAVVRFARALIPAGKPLAASLGRALSVWQVFDQEMAIAASKGTLGAIVADAELFASQVEASVEPAVQLAAPVKSAPEVNEHPEDPNGLKTATEPGSVFGWKPIEDSPNHGLPILDALIRRVLAEKKGGYPKGFELPGAAAREDARIHFYGERHTDGALIAANMKRLIADARPGKPMLVLVESYVGRTLRGWEAVKYLADRGLDPDELVKKGAAIADVEVRGWDAPERYQAAQHPMLQHHMNLLALNHLAHGPTRGWRYYRDVARAALTAWRSYREMWRAVIVARNLDLDLAVAEAAKDADETGATVHIIAGTDHLMQNPRFGRPSMRRTLRAALGGRPSWMSQPPNSRD